MLSNVVLIYSRWSAKENTMNKKYKEYEDTHQVALFFMAQMV